MDKVGFYDRISLTCLVIGGLLLVTGGYFAICESWLYVAVLGISGLLLWYLSTIFARYAIAASGRQR